MIEHPGLLLTVVAFVLMIGPLVFLHEMGHYLAGRLFGIGAETFSIGFGHEIAGWTDRRGTRWKLGWLPLGGYVKFAGDLNATGEPDADWLALPPAERNRTFQAKPVWQRAIVVAAGPVTNIVIAVLILAGFAYAYGDLSMSSVVGSVIPGSSAQQIGLQPGDRITAIGGHRFDDFEAMAHYVVLRPGERLTVDWTRGDRSMEAVATIATRVERDGFGNTARTGLLGVGPSDPVFRHVSLLDAPVVGVERTIAILRVTVDGIGQVVTGHRSIKDFSGPVGTARIAGEQMALGLDAFVGLIALVSINLGFINLLPVPVLDGGHLFFYAIEAVRRRPLGARAQEWAYRGGLAAILALFVVVTFNDLGAFGLWKGLAGLIG